MLQTILSGILLNILIGLSAFFTVTIIFRLVMMIKTWLNLGYEINVKI
jgi:hypothetical protein